MKAIEASIEVTRSNVNKSVVSISIMMPVWHKGNNDGNIDIKIPLLGIETTAKDENDIKVSVDEAIRGFIWACEKFGRGLQDELKDLGWSLSEDENKNPIMGYDVLEKDTLLERLFDTGEPYVNRKLELQVA